MQNVVTYTVIVDSANPELKLLPGMTANLSFQIEKHSGVLAVPNAAFRFFPKPEQVRPDDRAILETTTARGPVEDGRRGRCRRIDLGTHQQPAATSGCSTATCWPPCRS